MKHIKILCKVKEHTFKIAGCSVIAKQIFFNHKFKFLWKISKNSAEKR